MAVRGKEVRARVNTNSARKSVESHALPDCKQRHGVALARASATTTAAASVSCTLGAEHTNGAYFGGPEHSACAYVQ